MKNSIILILSMFLLAACQERVSEEQLGSWQKDLDSWESDLGDFEQQLIEAEINYISYDKLSGDSLSEEAMFFLNQDSLHLTVKDSLMLAYRNWVIDHKAVTAKYHNFLQHAEMWLELAGINGESKVKAEKAWQTMTDEHVFIREQVIAQRSRYPAIKNGMMNFIKQEKSRYEHYKYIWKYYGKPVYPNK